MNEQRLVILGEMLGVYSRGFHTEAELAEVRQAIIGQFMPGGVLAGDDIVGHLVDILKAMGDDDERCEALARLLKVLPPHSKLGTALLNAIWDQTPMFAVEVVCFRKIDGVDCVFLRIRDEDEAHAGQLHSKGTLVWAQDESLEALLERLNRREYGLVPGALRLLTRNPIEVVIGQEIRGTMGSLLYIGDFDGEPAPDKGAWHPVSGVAKMTNERIVDDHRDRLIPLAYRAWLETQMEPMDGLDFGYIVLTVKAEGSGAFPAAELQQARAMALRLVASGGDLGPEVWDRVED